MLPARAGAGGLASRPPSSPSRAPPGKHVLWVQVRVLPVRTGDAAGRMFATQWDEAKEPTPIGRWTSSSTMRPDFRSTILARTVHSPLDLERENPNLVGGDSLGRPASSRSEFLIPSRVRLVALSDAGQASLHGRRFDLARPRHRCRLGVRARRKSCRCATMKPNPYQFVMAGLVPAIQLREPPCPPNRDRRDRPGGGRANTFQRVQRRSASHEARSPTVAVLGAVPPWLRCS